MSKKSLGNKDCVWFIEKTVKKKKISLLLGNLGNFKNFIPTFYAYLPL